MTDEQRIKFNERYLPLYEEFLATDDPDEAVRLKDEMTQLEMEAGLYGSL